MIFAGTVLLHDPLHQKHGLRPVYPQCRAFADRSRVEGKKMRLGEAGLSVSPNPAQLAALRQSLELEGFELLDDRKSQLLSAKRIKNQAKPRQKI